MINKCYDAISLLLDKIFYSQLDNIKLASKTIYDAIRNGGSVYFFGQGHSIWVGNDVVGEYDFPIVSINDNIEMIDELLLKKQLSSDDVMIIVSNSGINMQIVELAIKLKNSGIKIIAITSKNHAVKVTSRHPSGFKLHMYGDVVIDNCCAYGDVAIFDDGYYLGSFSSIANNVIAHTMMKMCKDMFDK